MGFGVSGLTVLGFVDRGVGWKSIGYGAWALRWKGSGFGVEVWGLGLKVQVLGLGVQGFGCGM